MSLSTENILALLGWVVFPICLMFLVGGKKQYLSYAHTSVIKGVAIVLIIFHHLSQRIEHAHTMKLYQDFGFLGVSIFLFLSGYGITESVNFNGLSGFMKKRLMRVWLPFVSVSILWGITLCFSSKSPDFSAIALKTLGLYLISGSYWYIYCIAYLYVIFYFSRKFFGKLYLASVASASMVYWGACFALDAGKWWYTTVFCFFVGVIYSEYKARLNRCVSVILLVFCAVLLILSLKFSYSLVPLVASFSKTVTSVAFVIIVMFLFLFLARSSKMFAVIGNYSYEAYLTHVFVLGVLIGKLTFCNVVEFIFITVVMSIALKWWCYKLENMALRVL